MPNKTIRIVARIRAKPDCMDKVLAILSDVVEPTRGESGCISYELLQNRADRTDFTFVEEWTTDAAIDTHLAAKHIRDGLTMLSGLLSDEPDIRRYNLIT